MWNFNFIRVLIINFLYIWKYDNDEKLLKMPKIRKVGSKFMLLGKKIGRGNTAEVYELDHVYQKVMKLFYESIPFKHIKKEYETSKIINQLGIPSPNVDSILEVNNKWGIIYEKIFGQNFTQVLSSNPLLLKKNAHIFAKIQASFHQMSNDELAPQKEYLSQNIKGTSLLNKEEKELIVNYLKYLPADNKVCHGDYHPDNISLMKRKPIVLDWMTGTSGNPCGDVARTLIILRYASLPNGMPNLTKLIIQTVRKVFARFYLNSYIKVTNSSSESINRWFLPIMAARLVESIEESEKQFLLKKIKSILSTI